VFRDDLPGFIKATQGKMEYEVIDQRPKSHSDLLKELDVADLKKAAEVAGSRTYYLKNELVFLNLALLHFALEKIVSKGFTPMWPPFWLKEKAMKGVSHFGNFQDTLYNFSDEDNENFYFIPSSEQPMIAYFYDEVVRKKDLPFLCAGISTNFRREASAHGKDEGGLFRVHQFDKIEQVVICSPEDSEKWHEQMLKNGEEILQDLGIPHRVVSCCSGD
ncbi:MAG: serine--tRNA ligase, partial [Euryarchaeota archaeon HGW-Euryarchaeota-1]